MIPRPFALHRAESVDDAVQTLAAGEGEDAKLLAGGHSLLPLMKLRLAAPTLLIDIGGIADLRAVKMADGVNVVGAGTRHAELQGRAELGVIAHAASLIADQQVRNRGTIGGSLAHGDPASDFPALLLAAEGEVSVQGASGRRTIAASELFEDFLSTSLAADELITEVRFPSLAGWGWGYEKYSRRAEDWAIVGVCALVREKAGLCEDVRIGLTNMASTPLRASAAEEALRGGALDAKRIAAAAEQAAEGADPTGDLNAGVEYKRHLARVLTRRALQAAAGLRS